MDYIVKNKLPQKKFCVLDQNIVIKTAISEISKTIYNISGATIESFEIKPSQISTIKNAIFLCRFSDLRGFLDFNDDYNYLMGSDGFAVRNINDNIYILSHEYSGLFYGIHDFLEKNAEVIWYRGKKDCGEACIKSDDIIISNSNYIEKPFMNIRAWNMCGIGEQGSHRDINSIIYYAKNKINYKLGDYDAQYSNYGMNSLGNIMPNTHNLMDIAEKNPEYLMLEENGQPRENYDTYSFMNYYSVETARIFSEKIIEYLKNNPSQLNYIQNLMIPDDNFFRMEENGVVLSEQVFTTDDGVTVFPNESNYKSTVYYNFINRVVNNVCIVFPKTRFFTLAYLYAEICPKCKVDSRITVAICPISANDHIAFRNENSNRNNSFNENFKKWTKKGVRVAVYAYWNSFCSNSYPRPICKVVKDNLIYFSELGIKDICPEGFLDAASYDSLDDKFSKFDLNAVYTWIMNKLFWNPYQDIDDLVEKFCKIVYGQAQSEMIRFFNLIQKGWDNSNAFVFCATGADVYIRQFIINAGIADEILNLLSDALRKQLTEEQKRQIGCIYNKLSKQINDISKIEEEVAEALYSELGSKVILSKEQLNIENNKDSIWNKAKKLTSFYNYTTFEKISEQAKLNLRLIYDEKYIYIGFQIFDEDLSDSEIKYNEFMQPTAIRIDGSIVDSYTETYIGANILNMSEYYGYISGIFKKNSDIGIYLNNSSLNKIERPENFKESFYFNYDEDSKKRYYFHVQAIAFADLKTTYSLARPFGSFVYYNDKYGRFGWMGNGLWAKNGFKEFILKK